MSIVGAPFLFGGDAASTPDVGGEGQISRSLLMRSGTYFRRATMATTGGGVGTKWTLSVWVKGVQSGATHGLINGALTTGGNHSGSVSIGATGIVSLSGYSDNNFICSWNSTAKLIDPTAWYHVVISYDSATHATGTTAAKMAINGVDQAYTFNQNVGTYARNRNLFIGTNTQHTISPSGLYLANYHYINNAVLAPSEFGQIDPVTGRWEPKQFAGVYGASGFYLDFKNNSTPDMLGRDASGNNLHFTPTAISASTLKPITYVTPGTLHASNGVIPNGGEPYWVDILPAGASLSGGTNDVALLHDTSTSTYISWSGTQYANQGDVVQARFDLRDHPSITSIKVYCSYISATYTAYSARLLDANKAVIDGTTVTLDVTKDIPIAGTPRYLEIYCSAGVNRRLYLYGIQVNGMLLVNNQTVVSDSVVDSPSSFGYDSGIGSELRGNYATLNPLVPGTTGLSNGNLVAANANAYPTIIPGSGQWYYEVDGVGHTWDGTRDGWTPRAGTHNFGQRPFANLVPHGHKVLCEGNLLGYSITTSDNFTGNALADGPLVNLLGVPQAMTINGNAVVFGTHADRLAMGFKVRTAATTHNLSGTNHFVVTTTGAKFKHARAQINT